MNRGWIAVVFAVLAGSAQAQSAREKSDLAERCARSAAEVFAENWGPGGSKCEHCVSLYYDNHYNSRLNKCFYVEYVMIRVGAHLQAKLVDINERSKKIVVFEQELEGVKTCVSQAKECHTEQEWLELIEPFMEE